MRWQMLNIGSFPNDLTGIILFVFNLFLNPWIIVSIIATMVAGISWMLTMSKFEISYAYPWIGLNFVLMLLFGVIFFEEPINFPKILGTFMIVGGLAAISKG